MPALLLSEDKTTTKVKSVGNAFMNEDNEKQNNYHDDSIVPDNQVRHRVYLTNVSQPIAIFNDAKTNSNTSGIPFNGLLTDERKLHHENVCM